MPNFLNINNIKVVLNSELCHSVKSFDEKLYICETYKHLYKNEVPCQAAYNKTALDPISEKRN